MTPDKQHMKSLIRVLLVEDSLLTLAILRRMLAAAPDIQVVGTATNGEEALNIIPLLKPDVICTDLHMPVMDGFELTREVMRRFPRPILVLSVSVQKDETENIFRLLDAGAIDVMAKPRGDVNAEHALNSQELIGKIRILAGVVPIRKRRLAAADTGVQPLRDTPAFGEAEAPRVIGIGASTGGPQALAEILAHLPPRFPVPVLCIQHISEGFMEGLVEWLSYKSDLKMATADAGMIPQPGTVYFPREGVHLVVDAQGRLECSSEPPHEGHRPSISVTFRSLARHYGRSAVGILLTGMGRDGLDGMRAIADVGGTTIAQDEESSVVFGMPREAIAAHAARYVLPLPAIAPALVKLLGLPAEEPR